MSEMEYDDTHICLKCNTTVVGLDNYVFHRKQQCKASSAKPSSGSLIDPPSLIVSSDAASCLSVSAGGKDGGSRNDEDAQPKADDFFHSLELQSSAIKRPSLKVKSSGVRTRRAVADSLAGKKAKEKPKVVPKNRPQLLKKPDKPRKEDNPDVLEPFQDIPDLAESHMPYDDYTGGKWPPPESLASSLTDPFQSDVDLQYQYPPLGHTGGKWKPGDQHLFDTDPPPASHTGGKWKPGNFEDGHSSAGGKWKSDHFEYHPASGSKWKSVGFDDNHPQTGGKWKPYNFEDSHPQTGGKWKSVGFDDHHPQTGGKWKSVGFDDHHPHTGGKTFLGQKESSDLNSILPDTWLFDHEVHPAEDKSSEVYLPPPPPPTTATRGKWMPGKRDLRKSGSTVEYFCKPCNRRLTSRAIYEKHLLSEYHSKRVNSLDESHKDGWSGRSPKRAIRRSPWYNDCVLGSGKRKKRPNAKLVQVPDTPLDLTSGTLQCEACKSRVPEHLLGKHLVSHFHCFKAVGHPKEQEVILGNMDKIVRQAPFQCGLCRFYCNTAENLLFHWESDMHKQKDDLFKGYYQCSFCKHQCDTSEAMMEHLTAYDHTEMVAVIGKSVPLVIRKYVPLECPKCGRVFKYNFELKAHVRSEHGDKSYLPPSEIKLGCKYCEYTTISDVSLQKHLKYQHKEKDTPVKFFCHVCKLHFQTKEAAVQHRRTPEHRYLREGRKGQVKTRSCPHCNDKFLGDPRYRLHLKQRHPERCSRCYNCGQIFALRQELARHTSKGCSPAKKVVPEKSQISPKKSPVSRTCSLCAFQSDSQAEVLFHQALHEDPQCIAPTKPKIGSKNENTALSKYRCPICSNYFQKNILRGHIRKHLGDRPFQCPECTSKFTTTASLNGHIRRAHTTQKKHSLPCPDCPFMASNPHILERHRACHKKDRTRTELCDVCGKAFFSKYNLVHHQKLHTGKLFKCTHQNCIFSCRSEGELRAHRRIHSDERPYECDMCEYAAKTHGQLARHRKFHEAVRMHKCPHCEFTATFRGHLRRHLRLHTGAKPFKCPYCNYKCNLLENLRKHILQTVKHVGKHMYECRFCPPGEEPYATDLSTEFRIHLCLNHKDQFPNTKAITSYLAGLYDADDDPETTENPLPVVKKRLQPNYTLSKHPSVDTAPEVPPKEPDNVIYVNVLPEEKDLKELNIIMEEDKETMSKPESEKLEVSTQLNNLVESDPGTTGPTITADEVTHYEELVNHCLQTLNETGSASPGQPFVFIFE